MNYSDTLATLMTVTRTENLAVTYSTTGSSVLDYFSIGGALRHREEKEVIKKPH